VNEYWLARNREAREVLPVVIGILVALLLALVLVKVLTYDTTKAAVDQAIAQHDKHVAAQQQPQEPQILILEKEQPPQPQQPTIIIVPQVPGNTQVQPPALNPNDPHYYTPRGSSNGLRAIAFHDHCNNPHTHRGDERYYNATYITVTGLTPNGNYDVQQRPTTRSYYGNNGGFGGIADSFGRGLYIWPCGAQYDGSTGMSYTIRIVDSATAQTAEVEFYQK
jgi:hypothetical protein